MANLPHFKKRQKWQICVILFKIILNKFRIIVDYFCKFFLITDKRQKGKNGRYLLLEIFSSILSLIKPQ
jgi:hypothetical protein